MSTKSGLTPPSVYIRLNVQRKKETCDVSGLPGPDRSLRNTSPLCGRESVPKARISSASITAGGNFFSLVILTINIVLFVLMSTVEVRIGRGAEAFMQSASNGVLDDFGALVPSMVFER